MDEIDIYFLVAFQMYSNSKKLVRSCARFDWLRQHAAELHHIQHCDGVIVRSDKDRAILKGYLPNQRVAVVHPWFEGLDELQSIPATRPKGNELLFVGAMNLPPNIEAASFLAGQVFPGRFDSGFRMQSWLLLAALPQRQYVLLVNERGLP